MAKLIYDDKIKLKVSKKELEKILERNAEAHGVYRIKVTTDEKKIKCTKDKKISFNGKNAKDGRNIKASSIEQNRCSARIIKVPKIKTIEGKKVSGTFSAKGTAAITMKKLVVTVDGKKMELTPDLVLKDIID